MDVQFSLPTFLQSLLPESHYRAKPSYTRLAWLCIHQSGWNCAVKENVKTKYLTPHSTV